MPLLSVIVPVYNEKKTIKEILEKIQSVPVDKEIIVVNDGSFDGTDKILRDMQYGNLKVIHHPTNRGKGAAFLTGLSNATGEFVIIQDADLEYEPNDYLQMVRVINETGADLILGARFLKGHVGLFVHRVGNRLLTGLLNLLFNSQLNDYATCYKFARRTTWESLNLKAGGFDIEAEMICKALKNKKHILEVPISYYPRTYKAGKKIRWSDGIWAIFYIFKYRFLD